LFLHPRLDMKNRTAMVLLSVQEEK
jgi:hypothetical protein